MVDTADTRRLWSRMRSSRQEPKNSAYAATVVPPGPDRLRRRTFATGHTTNVARSAVTAVAARTIASSGWRTRAAGTARLAGGEATVHDQLGPRHVRRFVARQEQGDLGDLPRLGDAAERDPRGELAAQL